MVGASDSKARAPARPYPKPGRISRASSLGLLEVAGRRFPAQAVHDATTAIQRSRISLAHAQRDDLAAQPLVSAALGQPPARDCRLTAMVGWRDDFRWALRY